VRSPEEALPDGRFPGARLLHARLRLVLDAAQMGMWDWDVLTGRLVWDARTAALFGTTLDQVSGTIADVEERVHPDDMPRVDAVLSGAIETAGVVDVEFRVVLDDGAVRWLHGRGQALTDDTGRVVRLIGANLDVTDTRRTEHLRTLDAQRMAGLVEVAHALGAAGDEEAVARVLTGHCASALGAHGTVLVLREGDAAPRAAPTTARAQVRVLTSASIEQGVRDEVAVLPADFPLPMVHTAITGTEHFLPDRAAAASAFPAGEDLYARAGTQASATVPLAGAGGPLGALGVAFTDPRVWRGPDRDLLRALAALAAQALERIRALDAEMEAARAVGRLSETLQRALLTAPPQPDDLAIVARYLPAAQQAQVGGDWYDAFVNPDGNTMIVIGDVSGHDQDAAAAMAQTRNVLRGVAQAVGQPPAAVLSLLDRALARLQVHTLATAVLCDVRPASISAPVPEPAAGDAGPAKAVDRVLRWASAGHPPPLLIRPDRTVVVLEEDPDLLLGVDPETRRVDHEHPLAVGDTVLLYTDGMIERRGESLDEAVTRLRDAARDVAHLPLEDLVDALLDRLAGDAEDDVAVIALRPLAPVPS